MGIVKRCWATHPGTRNDMLDDSKLTFFRATQERLREQFLLGRLGRGEVGVYKVQAYPKFLRWDWQGLVPKCSLPRKKKKNSSKEGIWSSKFWRDLSQIDGRTPRDTHVPLYTRATFPWPSWDVKVWATFPLALKGRVWVSLILPDWGWLLQIHLEGITNYASRQEIPK